MASFNQTGQAVGHQVNVGEVDLIEKIRAIIAEERSWCSTCEAWVQECGIPYSPVGWMCPVCRDDIHIRNNDGKKLELISELLDRVELEAETTWDRPMHEHEAEYNAAQQLTEDSV